MNYRIVFSKLLDMLLPPMLRTKRMKEYMLVASKPIEELHNEFVLLVDECKNELSFEDQTQMIQQRLNEQFGQIDKIAIVNLSNGVPTLYIGEHNIDLYRVNIGEHTNSSTRLFISEHNQYNNNLFDFEVIINNAYYLSKPITADDINVIASIANRYNPFGKRFRIKTTTDITLYPL